MELVGPVGLKPIGIVPAEIVSSVMAVAICVAQEDLVAVQPVGTMPY